MQAKSSEKEEKGNRFTIEQNVTKKEPLHVRAKTLLLVLILFSLCLTVFSAAVLICDAYRHRRRNRLSPVEDHTDDNVRHKRPDKQHDRQHLRNCDRRVRDKQRIRPDSLDPRSSKAIASQIQKPHLPLELFMFPVKDHKEQQPQIPKALI